MLDKKRQKLSDQYHEIDNSPEFKAVKDKIRATYREDRLESPNPIIVAKELSENGDKTAYDKAKNDFVAEAKRQVSQRIRRKECSWMSGHTRLANHCRFLTW